MNEWKWLRHKSKVTNKVVPYAATIRNIRLLKIIKVNAYTVSAYALIMQ